MSNEGYKGIIQYPTVIDNIAEQMAKARQVVNEHLNQHCPQGARDGRELELDMIGIRAELIAWHYLETRGYIYQAGDLARAVLLVCLCN